MDASMWIAKTGLSAQSTRMSVIANNLANVNTTGFKRERVNFETLLYQVLRSSGEQTSADTNLTSAFSVVTGVRVVNADKLFSQGSIVSTDNALDLAVDGAGFFQVLLPDGRIGYTRNGTFSRNNEGALTTSSGFVIQPEVVIPEDAQEINVSSEVIESQIPSPQTDVHTSSESNISPFDSEQIPSPIAASSKTKVFPDLVIITVWKLEVNSSPSTSEMIS